MISNYFFQIWINDTNEIPPLIKKNFDNIKKNNPNIICHIYNNQDCINFLKEYCDKQLLDAYHKLVPKAYKSDLIRYCILYKYGGIYLDTKMKLADNIKLESFLDKEYFVRDTKFSNKGIYNAFMVCKKERKELLTCINTILSNIKSNYYGKTSLCPTGPTMLFYIFNKNTEINCELLFDDIDNDDDNIVRDYLNDIYNDDDNNIIRDYLNKVYKENINNNIVTVDVFNYFKKKSIYYKNEKNEKIKIIKMSNKLKEEQYKYNNNENYYYLWEKKQIYLN